jgi:hypothetical protein
VAVDRSSMHGSPQFAFAESSSSSSGGSGSRGGGAPPMTELQLPTRRRRVSLLFSFHQRASAVGVQNALLCRYRMKHNHLPGQARDKITKAQQTAFRFSKTGTEARNGHAQMNGSHRQTRPFDGGLREEGCNVYTEDYVSRRARMIPLAVDARKQLLLRRRAEADDCMGSAAAADDEEEGQLEQPFEYRGTHARKRDIRRFRC